MKLIEWKPITELPEYNKWVLMYTKDGASHIAYIDKKTGLNSNSIMGDEVTHWKELDEPEDGPYCRVEDSKESIFKLISRLREMIALVVLKYGNLDENVNKCVKESRELIETVTK